MAKEKSLKIKISQIADELGIKSKDVIAKVKEVGIEIKSANSSVTQEVADDIYNYIASGKIPKQAKVEKSPKNKPKKELPETKNKTEMQATPLHVESKIDSNPSSEEILRPKPLRKVIIVSRNGDVKEDPKKEDSSTRKEILSIRDMQDTINAMAQKQSKKKKKEQKKHTQKHTNETKIDIDRNMGDTVIDDNEKNEVLLFDFNEVESRNDEENKEKIEDRVRIQRNNHWFSDNIKRSGKRKKRKWTGSVQTQANNETLSKIVIPDEIRVYEFADKVGLKIADVISQLFKMGEMVTKNDFLDSTMIKILAQEFNINVVVSKSSQELEYLENDEEEKDIHSRAPVVTIMGHVDHGKTSLLDYIRKSNISKNEYGGITQSIGAYTVNKNGKSITFIDTPGHEAFVSMRSRGAEVTDIAIIVIAADDGVKQQTKEVLQLTKNANVQIIIAMNKIDKENANIDKLKAEMAEIGYSPSDWGGEYDFIPISARSGEGVDNLLDNILIQAEIMELNANISGKPKAIILEGSLDKGKGPIVTTIVKSGILRVGDNVVADTAYGKVRALIKDDGTKVNEIKPSEVAILVGLNEVPDAGSTLVGVDTESIAKEYATKRKLYLRTKELSKSTKISFDELSEVVAEGKLKPLSLIIKADTRGALDAIKLSLEQLSNDEVKVNVISSSVGNINENDINTAHSAKNCYIVGFNVKPLGILKNRAKELNISIKSYSTIYDIVDDIKEIISQMMSPIIEEEIIGNIEVRNIFSVGKSAVIAGCFVNDGIVQRSSKVRLIRGNKIIHTGAIASLKRFKEDVKEVGKGYECGIMIDNYSDIAVGDSIEIIKETIKNKK